MPLARVPLTGSFDVAMANVSLERKLTITNPGPNAASFILPDFELKRVHVMRESRSPSPRPGRS